MKRLCAMLVILFLAGCSTGTQVTDFTNRATVYGWVNVDKISGNHLFGMRMRQYSPQTEAPFYGMAFREFEGGYIFWNHGIEPGRIELHDMRLQSCLVVLCTNTINIYEFGDFGSAPGNVTVTGPSVNYIGNFALTPERTGLFKAPRFDATRTNAGPSRAKLLQFLRENASPEFPVIQQRLQSAR